VSWVVGEGACVEKGCGVVSWMSRRRTKGSPLLSRQGIVAMNHWMEEDYNIGRIPYKRVKFL